MVRHCAALRGGFGTIGQRERERGRGERPMAAPQHSPSPTQRSASREFPSHRPALCSSPGLGALPRCCTRPRVTVTFGLTARTVHSEVVSSTVASEIKRERATSEERREGRGERWDGRSEARGGCTPDAPTSATTVLRALTSLATLCRTPPRRPPPRSLVMPRSDNIRASSADIQLAAQWNGASTNDVAASSAAVAPATPTGHFRLRRMEDSKDQGTITPERHTIRDGAVAVAQL